MELTLLDLPAQTAIKSLAQFGTRNRGRPGFVRMTGLRERLGEQAAVLFAKLVLLNFSGAAYGQRF